MNAYHDGTPVKERHVLREHAKVISEAKQLCIAYELLAIADAWGENGWQESS